MRSAHTRGPRGPVDPTSDVQLVGSTGPVSGAAARTRRPLALASVLALTLLAGCASSDEEPLAPVDVSTATPEATAVPADPVPAPATTDPGANLVGPFGDIPVRTADEQPAPAPPAPTALSIPSLGIDMPVITVGVADDGTMGLPKSVYDVGWYEFGPAPASPAGTTVMASHVDSAAEGLGPFAELIDIEQGAEVVVADASGVTHLYTVSSIERVSKSEVQLDSVFARDGDRRLVLVTCGGDFDRSIGHYVDNVIVTAVPAA